MVVKEDTKHTDADQANKNLLLSPEAIKNTNPQLEIYSEDVKCSHGSTTGQIDPEALFYLQSRGISKSKAIELIINGFAKDIICLLYTSPSPRDVEESRMPSSA